MKHLYLILILLGISFSYGITAELSDDLEERQEELSEKLKLLSVDDDDFEDDNDNEYFVLKVRTRQDERATDLRPVMRIAVRLFDKKTQTTVYAQKEQRSKGIPGNNQYAGSTNWEFHIPFGDMKKPKLVAYAVEFGVKEGGTLIAGASEYDDVDSVEEILTGEGTKVQVTKATCEHERNSN